MKIRVWNYVKGRCELARKFYVGEVTLIFIICKESATNDLNPLLSVAFHPSGYYIAAGFIDKLRFFHLMHDELRIFKEVPAKNCT